MRISAIEFIEILEDAEFRPRSYSGRGMYGRECVGVELSPSEMLALGAELACAAIDSCGSDADRIGLLVEGVRDIMRGARDDQIGRSNLIVYWPNLEWPEGRPDADDDDE